MTAKKTAPSKNRPAARTPTLAGRLLSPAGRAVMAGALLAVFAGGWHQAWQVVGPRVLVSDAYTVTPDRVQITPPPAWVHSDVRAEALRNAAMDGSYSILDDDLAPRLHAALALHPWVAAVGQVRKYYPARVVVELTYRRPVCMVAVTGGLLPVDGEGVLLPSGDFTPVEARRYPRLVGVETAPVGPAGTCWGDPRVVGAAQIAAALGPDWQSLGLDRIVASPLVEMQSGGEHTYDLFTRGGTRVVWGRSPKTDMPGEPPAADKVARLKKYYREHGTLEGATGPQQLDVRREDLLYSGPQTAAKPHTNR